MFYRLYIYIILYKDLFTGKFSYLLIRSNLAQGQLLQINVKRSETANNRPIAGDRKDFKMAFFYQDFIYEVKGLRPLYKS